MAGDRFAREHRQQRGKRFFNVALRALGMTHRHVEAFVLLDGERKSRESRLHRARNGSVRLDNQRGRIAQPFDKAGERGGRVDDGYAHVRTEHRLLFDGGSACCRLRLSGRRRDTRDKAAELQLPEDVQYVVAREPPERGSVEIEPRRGRGLDGDEVLALEQLLRMLAHEALYAGRRHFVHALDERLGAAELGDKFHRRFVADAGNAGDVVGRIACERLHVTLLVRFEPAVALAHGLHVVHPRISEAGGEQDADVR